MIECEMCWKTENLKNWFQRKVYEYQHPVVYPSITSIALAMMGGRPRDNQYWYAAHRADWIMNGNLLDLQRMLRHVR